MVIKRLSCVFRLTDGWTNKPLQSAQAAVCCAGKRLAQEYKEGGYFVITDLPCGEYTFEIKAVGFQLERVCVTVGESANDEVIFMALNPSREHPAAASSTCVCGSVQDVTQLYLVRAQGRLCVAEEKAAAGAQEIRMFGEGKLVLPAYFLLGEGAHAEVVTISSNNGGLCKISRPLKYTHKRSENALPLIRLQCENGFFAMLGDDFAADNETGKIPLRFAAVKKEKIVFASAEILPKKMNSLGELY